MAIGPNIAQVLAKSVTPNKPRITVMTTSKFLTLKSLEKPIPKVREVKKTYSQLSRMSAILSND